MINKIHLLEDVMLDIPTPKQLDVLRLVALGYTNKEIAEKMCLSEHTIKSHINELYQKFSLTGSGCKQSNVVRTRLLLIFYKFKFEIIKAVNDKYHHLHKELRILEEKGKN